MAKSDNTNKDKQGVQLVEKQPSDTLFLLPALKLTKAHANGAWVVLGADIEGETRATQEQLKWLYDNGFSTWFEKTDEQSIEPLAVIESNDTNRGL